MPDAILPIVIAEERVTTVVQAVIVLPEEALFIERINTQVEIDRCRVVNGAVLIRGRVIINVPFKTGRFGDESGGFLSRTRVVCGDLRHCTAFIPFSLIATVPGVLEGDQCRVLTACVIDLITDLMEGRERGLSGLSGFSGSSGMSGSSSSGLTGTSGIPTRVTATPVETLGTAQTLGTMGMNGRTDGRGRSGRNGNRGMTGNLGATGNLGLSGRRGSTGNCRTTGGRGRTGNLEASGSFESTGDLTGTVVAAGWSGESDSTAGNDRLAITAEVCIRFRVTREETVDVGNVRSTERFVTFPSFQ